MKILVLLVLLFTTEDKVICSLHLSCPAQDWTLGSTITLRCYLRRVDYPSRCTFSFNDKVTFRRQPFTGSGSDRCTVNDVSTTSCTPSSSECGCQPANATYFIVHHTFTVDADDDGTWQCSVACLDSYGIQQLTFTSDNCDDREVVAHAVLSTPTMTVTTPDTGSGWTVRGTVDITRIFSSTGHYSCMWSYRTDSGQYADITSSTITIDPPANGTSVRTGQCGFPDRLLPSVPGTYTYRVTVSPGRTVKTDSSVVIGKPRSRCTKPEIPTVNFIDKPVSVAFSLEALPLPDSHRFQHLGKSQISDMSQPIPNSIELSATCTTTYAFYAVMCNVTVDRVNDSSAEGFYIYTAANDFGEERFVFRVTLRASSVHPEDESSVSVGAAVGITLAVVIIIVLIIDLIIIIWVWRRGWILPCASDSPGRVGQETRQRKELNTERPPLESAGPPVSEDYELIEGGSRRHAGGPGRVSQDTREGKELKTERPPLESAGPPVPEDYELIEGGSRRDAGEHQSPSPYVSLQTSDVGVPSVYSQISQHSDTVSAVHQGPVYEINVGEEQS